LKKASPIFNVELRPSGRRVKVASNTTQLEATQKAGIDLVASCGGSGFCGTCFVKVVEGNVSATSPMEREVLGEARLQQNLWWPVKLFSK
jgi:ferredoxin